MISYNQILSVFNQIANAHLQVKQYGAGSPADIPEGVNYPLMWVVYDPTSINLATKSEELSFKILFADLLHEDKSNEQEILSDQKQTLCDVVAQLQLPAYGDRWEVGDIVRAEPLVESLTTDNIAGWLASITLRTDYLSDACQVPSTLNPSEDQGCPSVSVYDSTGALLATVEAGLSYTVTDSNVHNSNSSYSVNVRAQQSLALPNSSIRDLAGNLLHTLPATRDQVIANTRILDQNGAQIDSVLAEGSYSVIVFSGIDGGNASTTYSNSIIDA